MLNTAPTVGQSYVEVNDMKHYSTEYELEKDGVVLSFKSEQIDWGKNGR